MPYIESSDTPVRVMLEPFAPDDPYHGARDAITRSKDLAIAAETVIVRAHAGFEQGLRLGGLPFGGFLATLALL
ncbi:MAG: hypothetical protein ACXWWK_06255 [Gemmatimonadales bacterium]